MKFLLPNHLAIARQSIKSNRLRSVLTMVGITIGVASITTIIALSAGASRIISDQVDELGGTIAVIRSASPSHITPTLGDALKAPSNQHYTISSLGPADVTALQDIPNIVGVAPLMIVANALTVDGKLPQTGTIIATTPDLQAVSDLVVDTGQFLDPRITAASAVIGTQQSIDLFGTDQSVGRTVTIKDTPFTIIGVDLDRSVIINLDEGRALNQGASTIQQITVRSASVSHLGEITTQINKALLKTHSGQADFVVLTGAAIAQPTSDLFAAIAGVTIAIATISLIVGGIGVMNIMLVTVAERTREIGIRKALGATSSDIIGQFLMESLILSIGGGIAGYLIGYAAAFAISLLLTFDPAFTWEGLALALTASLVTGVLFGIYPAARAARRDPISALRLYD